MPRGALRPAVGVVNRVSLFRTIVSGTAAPALQVRNGGRLLYGESANGSKAFNWKSCYNDGPKHGRHQAFSQPPPDSQHPATLAGRTRTGAVISLRLGASVYCIFFMTW